VVLRLHGPGGALVLEHDFVLLLHLPGEKAHVVYFRAEPQYRIRLWLCLGWIFLEEKSTQRVWLRGLFTAVLLNRERMGVGDAIGGGRE
jgi:hypothetical protein